MALTTTELLTDIRQRGQIPTATPVGVTDLEAEVTTDEGLLNLAGDELRTFVLPLLVQRQSEFLVHTELVDVNATGRYRIPKRALGGQLRALLWRPAGGTAREDVPLFQVGPEESEEAFVFDRHYSVEGSRILLRDDTITSGSLVMRYWLRPGALVPTGDCWTVSAVTQAGGVSTVTVTGSGGDLSAAGAVDVIKGTPIYEPILLDVTPTGATTTTGGLADENGDVEVGDYLAPAGSTPIVPLPEEYHPLLAQRVAVRALEILGFNNDLKNAQDELVAMVEGLGVLLSHGRVQGSPRKIRNKSAWGL